MDGPLLVGELDWLELELEDREAFGGTSEEVLEGLDEDVTGEPRLVELGGNQALRREGETGIVMREWITWVMGAVSGAGKDGGSVLNVRSR